MKRNITAGPGRAEHRGDLFNTGLKRVSCRSRTELRLEPVPEKFRFMDDPMTNRIIRRYDKICF